jgi:alkylresorcinol/alkylpyrone synthase
VRNFIHNLFSSYPEIDKMINVFDNSEIKQRHFSVPMEWFAKPHSFGERNKLYRENAIKMTKSAIEECLEKSGISKDEINCIIMVSSTGIVTPTLDAILFNELGFNRHIKRIPIWGWAVPEALQG